MKTSTMPTLDGLPLFETLPPRDQRMLLKNSTEVTVPAGHELIQQGSRAVDCMVLLDGTARVEIDGALVTIVGPGSLIGELALLDHGPRSASVVTETDSRLLVFGAHEFSLALGKSPAFARRVLREVAFRLRESDRTLAER